MQFEVPGESENQVMECEDNELIEEMTRMRINIFFILMFSEFLFLSLKSSFNFYFTSTILIFNFGDFDMLELLTNS